MKICFVCLGNICRSPMAKFMLEEKLRKKNIKNIMVYSKGTSNEEEGNDMHYKAKEILTEKNIPFQRHYASKLTKEDYDKYDYFIGMDDYNIRSMSYLFNDSAKIKKLLPQDIADPWYTNDFETTYNDLDKGLDELISSLL